MNIGVILIVSGLVVAVVAWCVIRDGALREAAQMEAWRRHCDEYERAAQAQDPCSEFHRKQLIMREMFDETRENKVDYD